MAVASLSGFQVFVQGNQIVPGLHIQEKLSGKDDASLCYIRQISRSVGSAMTAPGNDGGSNGKKTSVSKKKGASKTGRVDPVMAFRDQVSVCALASATLEHVSLSSARGASGVERGGLSPAGDSATTLERSRLESQWTLVLNDNVDEDMSVLEAHCPREGRNSLDQSEMSVVASSRHMVAEIAVTSGNPKARARRLEARQQRLAVTEKPPPPEAFTIFRPRKSDGKNDSFKRFDGIHDYLSSYLREITRIDRLSPGEELMLSKIVRTGFLMKEERKKLERTVGHELTKGQWASLVGMQISELDAKLHEAELARDRMVMANLRLVVSVVKQFKCQGIEVPDLIQEGSIGLMKGVEKFDYSRGCKLSTYVHWWIRQGVSRAIADHSRTVRLPVHVHDTVGRVHRAKTRIIQEGDTATIEALGEALNLSSDQVKKALKIPKRIKSLDMSVGFRTNHMTGDGDTFHNLVADKETENQPWTMVERALLKEDVEKMLNKHLGSRERDIIKMHFGVNCKDGSPMSLESISHRFGVSRERVRQLERAAKQKLQTVPSGLDKYCCMSI